MGNRTSRKNNNRARLSAVNAFQSAQARAHAQQQAQNWEARRSTSHERGSQQRSHINHPVTSNSSSNSSSQVVHCVRCRRALMPPGGHPRFRCPCGQIMANPFMVTTQRVRCPRCSGILAPVPGLLRFRCPCGALLTLPSGDLWRCSMCSHMNPAHRAGCEMCGENRFSSADSAEAKEKDELYVRERSRLMIQGKHDWTRRMDSDNVIRWARSFDPDDYLKQLGDLRLVTIEDLDDELNAGENLKKTDRTVPSTKILSRLIVLLSASKKSTQSCFERSDFLEKLKEVLEKIYNNTSTSDLKKQLSLHCVDHGKCIEKSELITAYLVSATLRAHGRSDGWVRSFVTMKNEEGKRNLKPSLDWIPANQAEIRLHIPGLSIDFQELRAATALPFRRKLQWFRHQVKRMAVEWSQGHVKVRVRRSHLLQDSYDAFRKLKPGDFRKIFQFEFIGEPALDVGGVAREWFALLGQSIFNVDFGLFQWGDVDNLCYQINPNSGIANDLHLQYFRFAGRLIGKALFDRHIVPAHLTLPLYKHMLAWPITLHDLEYVDREVARSLEKVLQSQSVESMMLDFSTTVESFGEIREVELKENGSEEEVNQSNRHEYVELMLKHIMLLQTQQQLSHLLIGFYEVIPEALVMIFDYQELELLICGLPHIDCEDWKENSVYKGNYKKTSKVVKWFWEVVEEMSEEKRARLLQFATGTSRVPVQGFKSLQSNQGKLFPFCLKSVPRKGAAFPVAHTCFNRIDLPEYSSKAELKKFLEIAIQMEAAGFGLE
eukprot:g3148.t1